MHGMEPHDEIEYWRERAVKAEARVLELEREVERLRTDGRELVKMLERISLALDEVGYPSSPLGVCDRAVSAIKQSFAKVDSLYDSIEAGTPHKTAIKFGNMMLEAQRERDLARAEMESERRLVAHYRGMYDAIGEALERAVGGDHSSLERVGVLAKARAELARWAPVIAAAKEWNSLARDGERCGADDRVLEDAITTAEGKP